MSATHICSTKRGSLDALRFQGFLVTDSHAQINTMLKSHLSREHALLFAEPVHERSGDYTDWYTQLEGKPVRLLDLPEDKQQEYKKRIASLAADIKRLSEELKADDNQAKRVRGNVLALTLLCPGLEHIYIIDGRPVITAWAFAPVKGETVAEDIVRLGAATPISFKAAPAQPPFSPQQAPPEKKNANRLNCISSLLLGVLASLALYFLLCMLFGPAGCVSPGALPSWCSGPLCPDAPSAEFALPARKRGAPHTMAALAAERDKEKELNRQLADLRGKLEAKLAQCPRPGDTGQARPEQERSAQAQPLPVPLSDAPEPAAPQERPAQVLPVPDAPVPAAPQETTPAPAPPATETPQASPSEPSAPEPLAEEKPEDNAAPPPAAKTPGQAPSEPLSRPLAETPVKSLDKSPIESPAQTPAQTPVEAPRKAPVEAPVETPREVPVEAPREAPADAPVAAPREAPVEAPRKTPVEVPGEAPVAVPGETPTQIQAKEPPILELPMSAPPEPKKAAPDSKPKPKAKPLKKGEEMRIPDQAMKEKDMTFLEGCWSSETGLVSTKGEPVNVQYCFDNKGSGTRNITETRNNTRCTGSVTAHFDGLGSLVFDARRSACNSGGAYVPQRIDCKPDKSGTAQCYGRNRSGKKWKAVFKRQ